MPTRPFFQPRETTRLADSIAFEDRAQRDIWALGFSQTADDDIAGLSKALELPDPLPVVVSDRPDAVQIRERQQQTQAASAAPVAMPTTPAPTSPTSATPSAEGVLPTRPAAPSGTPQAMPTTAPTGYTPSGGSNPEKQAIAYQEARASGLDEEGARILVAVTETEGGLAGAIGDQGQSRGGYQFHEGGQMPGFRAWLTRQGIQGDPNDLVNDIRLTTRYAATTYLGRAIEAGRAQGLRGADLATYVQQHGQVSVDPWKTGQNYTRLYGGSSPNAVAAQPPATAAPPPPAAPPTTGSSPTPAAGGSGGADTRQITIRHKQTGNVSRVFAWMWPGGVSNADEFDVVGESGPDQDMPRLSLGNPQPMPDDATAEHEMIYQTARPNELKPPPLRNVVPWPDTESLLTGDMPTADGVQYRAPLYPTDPDQPWMRIHPNVVQAFQRANGRMPTAAEVAEFESLGYGMAR